MKRLLVLPVLVALLLAAVACGGSSGSADSTTATTATATPKGYRPEPKRKVGKLSLADYAAPTPGTPFAFEAQPGGLLLVYFGYLSCPDICPLTMGDTAAALEALGADASKVQVAFGTVDLERDTGPEIVEYMTHFFTPDQIHALRADDEYQLHGVTYEFGAQWSIEPHEPGSFYGVAHSGTTYAVDDKGNVVWAWPFGTTGDELAAGIRTLLAQAYPAAA
jgi:cytochrome oxidase Cu insertion factor (SCO1/SenC/PrrC family)